jgi:2-polyprenyl-3-methyl-5-hydroxy-6-metoxy-1,4-benzoquinol methylase
MNLRNFDSRRAKSGIEHTIHSSKPAHNLVQEGEIRLENVNCPRCECRNSKLIYEGRDYLHNIPGVFFASECLDCKFLFQNPRPRAADIARLYPRDYLPHTTVDKAAQDLPTSLSKRRYLSEKYGYSHLQLKHQNRLKWYSLSIVNTINAYSCGVQLIPHFVPDGRLLEIGCASGARLLSLQKLGWQNLFGIELVLEAVEKARSHGFSVQCGQIEDAIDNYPDNYFDVIISSMVVEHLFNPFVIFEKITKKLKPGGQLLFSTVVRNSIDAKLYKGYWVGFDFPRHMVYFRKKDLMNILAGEYEDIKSFGQNAPIDFKRSSMWRIQANHGNFMDRIIVRIADGIIFRAIGYGIAWLGFMSRISFKATKIKNKSV